MTKINKRHFGGKLSAKVYYSVCSRIKGIDPIVPKFDSVLPGNSSYAL